MSINVFCFVAQLTKAKKMVKANDASSCGNAITEYRDNIVYWNMVQSFVSLQFRNRRDIYLSIPRSMLSTFDDIFWYRR
jgi:hypothetical protein